MKHRDELITLLTKLADYGNEHDFKSLYDLLYDKFFRIAIYYLKKEEWAQEVVLDVFLSIWNKRYDLVKINNFENYYFILLKNASLNYIEKHKQESVALNNEIKTEHSETPESNLLNDELLLIYINALEELPPKCREVFILIREQGLSYKEAAEQLDISTKTVDAQLQKAIKSIKEKIKSYFS